MKNLGGRLNSRGRGHSPRPVLGEGRVEAELPQSFPERGVPVSGI